MQNARKRPLSVFIHDTIDYAPVETEYIDRQVCSADVDPALIILTDFKTIIIKQKLQVVRSIKA